MIGPLEAKLKLFQLWPFGFANPIKDLGLDDRRSRYLASYLASDVSLYERSCGSAANNLSGFPFSFGIFQDYYSTHAPFSKEPSGIAIIGTSAMVWLFRIDVS